MVTLSEINNDRKLPPIGSGWVLLPIQFESGPVWPPNGLKKKKKPFSFQIFLDFQVAGEGLWA